MREKDEEEEMGARDVGGRVVLNTCAFSVANKSGRKNVGAT